MAETVYILIGSNIGNREKYLETAVEKISALPGIEMTATSAVYVTDPVDMVGENPSFLNQVIMAEYLYRPNELLLELEKIETELGRSEKGEMKPRTIDLDILLFGQEIINSEKLTIPHKALLNRAFAMIPLLQISPEIIHPEANRPIADFLREADKSKVILYKDHVARNI